MYDLVLDTSKFMLQNKKLHKNIKRGVDSTVTYNHFTRKCSRKFRSNLCIEMQVVMRITIKYLRHP